MKKIQYLIIALLCAMAQGAWADDVKFIYRYWTGSNTEGHVVSSEMTCSNYTTFSSSTSTTLSSGWYLLSGSVEYADRLTINGDVNFILQDGCNVKFAKGIRVKKGNTLTIYGQSGNSGYLRAEGSDGSNGAIGGNEGEIGGHLVIHGGKIYAKPSSNNCAGIGAGNGSSSGMQSITIYGGNVTGEGSSSGAGIGGGQENKAENSPAITIYGGTVTATGGYYAAGLGGGEETSNGTIKIFGGNITATGGTGKYDSVELFILGHGGACIGGGEDASQDNPIYIYGGTVNAKFAKDNAITTGAGIGGGYNGNQNAATYIYGGTVNATVYDGGAGIGGGYDGNGGEVYIYGGKVNATGGDSGAGIGGGCEANGGTLYVYGGTVTATGGSRGAGIGGGEYGKGGTVYVYDGTVIATGGIRGAGIGGGYKGYGGDVYVYGSKVTAEGQGDGFAIGGGENATDHNGTLTVGSDICVKKDGGDWVSISQRASAPMNDDGKYILQKCSHGSGSYQDKDSYEHHFNCSYCEGYDENHSLANESATTCAKCGRALPSRKVSFYVSYSGTGYGSAAKTYYVQENTEFTIPECYNVPEKMTFVGWLFATTEPNDIMATDGETLVQPGDKITIPLNSDNRRYFARYREVWTLTGSGTEADPYIIATTDDLDELAVKVNQGNDFEGKFVKLTTDLEYDGTENNYTAIGKLGQTFQGTFDGQGHYIKGININISSENYYQGVFGYIGKNGTVKNLTMTNSSITTTGSGGGIAGCNVGTIENCHATSSVTVEGNGNNFNFGGIAGRTEGKISGCTSAASVSNANSNVAGGVVGDVIQGAKVGYCLYLGNSVTAKYRAGAICGDVSDRHNDLRFNYYVQQDGLTNAIGTTSAVSCNYQWQAEPGYTVTSGTDGLEINFGTATTTFDYDGIKVYSFKQSEETTVYGLMYQGTLYSGNGQNVTFAAKTSSGKAITAGAATSSGTLTNNGDGNYTLTMGSADAVITADFASHPFAVTLLADGDNSSTLTEYNGCTANVTLSGTTLYRDGKVQTICLPFDVADFTGTPLAGFTVQTPVSGDIVEESTVFALNCDAVTAIEARKPYIIKWTSETADPIADPVFNVVVIDDDSPMEMLLGDEIALSGTYAPKTIGDGGNDYYVKTDGFVVNTPACTLPAQQVFIHNNAPDAITDIRILGSEVITHAWSGSGTEDDPYLIQSSNDFDALATFVNDNSQSYSGKYFKLTADIEPTKMVGQGTKRFQGRFDGDGHTITVNYTATDDYCAPFRYISGATIKNLHVDGTITTSARYAGGIVAYSRYYSKIENCRSSVVIRSSHEGWAGHGGILALKANVNLSKPTIEGCVFDGKILTTGTTATTGGAGIVGYTNGQTLTVKNCLYKPAALADGETAVECATIYENASSSGSNPVTSVTCTDCYYTEVKGSVQGGTQAYTVTSGTDGLTLDYGTATTTYDEPSTLKPYSFGLLYDGTLYSSDGAEVSFTAEANKEIPSLLANYEGVEGSEILTADDEGRYTLTMTDKNVTITMGTNYIVTFYDAPSDPANTDGKTNTERIQQYENGYSVTQNTKYVNFTIKGRTLYKDGYWNTLCLPFHVTDSDADNTNATTGGADGKNFTGTPLEGATVMVFDIEHYFDANGTRYLRQGDDYYDIDHPTNGYATKTDVDASALNDSHFDSETGTLYLYFSETPMINPGMPCLVKWDKPDGYDANPSTYDITDPTFQHTVIIDDTFPPIETADFKVNFKGLFDPETLDGGDKSNLYLGAGNTLYYPSDDKIINAFRGYFHVDLGTTSGVRAFVLNFGEDEATGIVGIEQGTWNLEHSAGAGWYDLSGRKLAKKPTSKGIYIYNGKKRIIK